MAFMSSTQMKMQMHCSHGTRWQKIRAKNRSSKYLWFNEASACEAPASPSTNSLINHHRRATRNTEGPLPSSSSTYSSSYLPSLFEELMFISIMSCSTYCTSHLCRLLEKWWRKKSADWTVTPFHWLHHAGVWPRCEGGGSEDKI